MEKANLSNPVIGKDISWKIVQDYLLRVISFTPLATVSGSEVQSQSSSAPYAILIVECLNMNSKYTLYVTHKIDFLHLWRAYNQRGVSDSEEVLIGNFAQRRKGLSKLMGAFLPRLFVWICPKGYLERMINDDWGGLTGEARAMAMLPLEMWEPET